MKTLKVGMLGCGVVGSQIARLLVENKSDLTSRAGANLELVKVAVKNINTKREGISSNLLTDDAKSVVRYFLANASTWKGDTAKVVKAHLKSLVK